MIRRDTCWLYKKAKTIAALNFEITIGLVDVDRLRSPLTTLLSCLEAMDVDVIIVHRKELLQDIDSLLLARGTWSCSRAVIRLRVVAIPCCMARLAAHEA